MKLQVVAVFDAKAETFGNPAYFQQKGIAIRSFGDQVEKDEMMAKHPEDFTLFPIGS